MSFLLLHILSIMIFLPFIVGFVACFCGARTSRILAIFTTLILLALGILLFDAFEPNAILQFSQKIVLIERFGINYSVGVNGINILIILIIVCAFAFLLPLLKSEKAGYFGALLFMESAFMFVISANNLMLFYAGWELMLVPIFVFMGLYGGKSFRDKAAFDMMYYAIFGSMIMLGAIIYLGYLHNSTFGTFSFELDDLLKLKIDDYTQSIIFACFMLAFAIKIPLFPFHAWLCNAYIKAPTPATFALSALASKVAFFAILNFVLSLCHSAFISFAELFVALGLISMIYFAIAAIRAIDFKGLLAYASASHLGFIIAGVFALSQQAMLGALYHSLAHALASGVLFLLVHKISAELGTREISRLGGLAIKAPIFGAFFGIFTLCNVGLPGTAGFVGEFLIIYGILGFNLIYGALAASSMVVGAVYMFIVYRKAILQSTNEITARFSDLGKRQIALYLIPVILVFVLGVFVNPLMDKIKPSVEHSYQTYIKSNQKEAK